MKTMKLELRTITFMRVLVLLRLDHNIIFILFKLTLSIFRFTIHNNVVLMNSKPNKTTIGSETSCSNQTTIGSKVSNQTRHSHLS